MMPIRPLAAALLLSGCLSPQAACFAGATVEYRQAWREAQRLEADLARGHALHMVAQPGLAPVTCHENGRVAECLVERHRAIALPVSIDAAAHRARLAVLDQRMTRLRPGAMAAAAPCGYGAPGGGAAMPLATSAPPP